ncbi:MAG: putative aminohydrolase SsnA [Clostridiales bacterium]|nr:putative aminohydrolase SsnA [Clostridiales bacterium]
MLLIGNGRLITRDLEHPYYENGAVLVENEKIVENGPYILLREKYGEARFIDAKGKVIMPGLINCHHHIYSAFARGMSIEGNSPKNFMEILEGTWWYLDRKLTLDHVYNSALATYMECIKNGVTTVFDHHASYGAVNGSLLRISSAAQKLSVRTCLSYEISDRDGCEKAKEAISENIQFINHINEQKNSMQKGMIGLHASFTISDETFAMCKEDNVSHAGYHVHVAEDLLDEQHCQKTYGESVVKRLYHQKVLGENSIAAHCIHIDKEDMGILKETNTTVIHNPQSNMGNGVGCADVIAMLEEGIMVGLGTDGYTSDMLESLKTANILQKHRRSMPDLGFVEAGKMLFENNSKIATKVFHNPIGVLKEGALADIVIMDYVPYTPMNAGNIDGHIMFGMSGAMTDTTIINGRILMQNKELLDIDEYRTKIQIMESANDLWSRL